MFRIFQKFPNPTPPSLALIRRGKIYPPTGSFPRSTKIRGREERRMGVEKDKSAGLNQDKRKRKKAGRRGAFHPHRPPSPRNREASLLSAALWPPKKEKNRKKCPYQSTLTRGARSYSRGVVERRRDRGRERERGRRRIGPTSPLSRPRPDRLMGEEAGTTPLLLSSPIDLLLRFHPRR